MKVIAQSFTNTGWSTPAVSWL